MSCPWGDLTGGGTVNLAQLNPSVSKPRWVEWVGEHQSRAQGRFRPAILHPPTSTNTKPNANITAVLL